MLTRTTAFPRGKCRLPRALLRGGRRRRQSALSPAFPGCSSLPPPRAPPSRAHTLLRLLLPAILFLSSCPPSSVAATMRRLSRFVPARGPLRPLASSRGGPRGVPGVVSSSHPLFHLRTAPARPGDVPLALSSSLPLPSVRSAEMPSRSLFRGPRLPPSPPLHPLPAGPTHSPLISPLRKRSRNPLSLARHPLFFSFPPFHLMVTAFIGRPPVLSFLSPLISPDHTRSSTSLRLPFRRAWSFSAGHSRRIKFKCVRDAKAGHVFSSFKGKTAGEQRKQSRLIYFFSLSLFFSPRRGGEKTKLNKIPLLIYRQKLHLRRACVCCSALA